ncbi:MAG: NUDIX hydrolase [Euryarchaeota archaeon]|nr:NUDIX hydrolase [Euryarchaeota archaeon]
MHTARTVFETKWFQILEESFPEHPELGSEPYYTIRAPPGVIVLALTRRREVVLVKQFRPAVRESTLEFPSGQMNADEMPEDAAARELLEETGYTARTYTYLGRYKALTSRNGSKQHVFVAEDASPTGHHEPERGIQVILATLPELKNRVASGEFDVFQYLGALVLADWKAGKGLLAAAGGG